jgi:GntR family transcriptional regulator/MocR family aminotransferase
MATKRQTRRELGTPLLPLALDHGVARPLQRQLFGQLREIILTGRVSPGSRLPSTRALARELDCSRNTVIGAYDQLYAEGYLEGASGSGIYVSSVLPEELLRSRPCTAAQDSGGAQGSGGAQASVPARGLSVRGRELSRPQRTPIRRSEAFAPGLPETALFPWDVWSRLLARAWRRPPAGLVHHGEAAGYRPLREAIAAYLRTTRAVTCDWRQVLITSGGQQCIDLTVKALTDPGDPVWIEDPGFPGLRGPLAAAGVRRVPVPVDGEGFALDVALTRAPEARLVIVTPSHQYPLGTVMSLGRRLQLLEWAAANGAYILEDDYDSEYRYSGRPLTALQGLDRAGRVVYAGSFSKVLFPSLRLGYLVLPEDLAGPVTELRRGVDDHPSAVAQPALADFFNEGHLAAHVRRMRRLYAERQARLLEAARAHLDGLLELAPDEAGLHLVADLAPALARQFDDREIARAAAAAGITAPALGECYLGEADRQGLFLGYAAVPEAEIEAKVETLAMAIRALVERGPVRRAG